MSDATPASWPEQDAVDAWCNKHCIVLVHGVRMELQQAVTEYRIKIQRKNETLIAALATAQAEVEKLRGAMTAIAESPAACVVWLEENGVDPFGFRHADGVHDAEYRKHVARHTLADSTTKVPKCTWCGETVTRAAEARHNLPPIPKAT